jgi:two-component system sensor histidine kinase HydH
MERKKTYLIGVIVISTFIITYLHNSLFRGQAPHVILEELYYIPIILAALFYGLKGALSTYLLVSAAYLPYLFGDWVSNILDLIDRLLHLLFSGIFAFLAGFLIDRWRKYQRQLDESRYLAGLGQMAATIVHDLKNPLITISAFSRRIQQRKTNTDTAIQRILNAAETMQKIMNGTLDFARPIHLELKEEDIVSIVRQACDSCRARAEEKRIDLTMTVPGFPVILPIDSLHMQRAITNIMDNSIEASREGQSVIIAVRRDKNDVKVHLRDNGSGMDKETLDSIFIPFYSKKGTGTGLGMAVAKKIVDEHKGKIHVRSRPSLGTEVIIELPYRSSTDSKP